MIKLAEQNTILASIKKSQNINDSTQDNLIKECIKRAATMINIYCNSTTVHEHLLYTCEEIALKMYLNHGLSPQDLSIVSTSFSGDSYSYDKDLKSYLTLEVKLLLNEYRRIRRPGGGT